MYVIAADNVLQHVWQTQENTVACYGICKSRNLLISCNQIGLCESYNPLNKQRKNLAKYSIINNADSDITLESHISNTSFTLAAFRSFDHLGWNNLTGGLGEHETAIRLFQEKK